MDMDDEPPEDLACPILFTLLRDPVLCEADGRVYEREGLVQFWRHRPLAGFHGGPALPSARMRPSLETRERVARWLAARPDVLPEGWDGRTAGHQCTQAELDELAAEIEALAASRRAAEALRAAEAAGQQPEAQEATTVEAGCTKLPS